MLEYDENQSIHCNNDYAICLRINNTGDLCPPPHGNFTFSDLPIVKRNGQTDHVSVAWTYQVDQRIFCMRIELFGYYRVHTSYGQLT